MFSPITLDALRTLDAISRRNSFAAAAEELHRVPSAISYTINKLEEDLGVILFDRSRRKAELTSVGRLVLDQGRQILKATDELTVLARQSAEGWEPELRICVDSILSPEPIFTLIERFQRMQPKTEIRLTEEVLGGSWDALNDDRCDLVIGAEGLPPSPGFGMHVLGRVVFEFTVSREHPLTKMPFPLTNKVIQDYPTVIVADSSRHMPARSAGLLDGMSRIIVPTIEHKIEAQTRGIGVGYLPRHRIQNQLLEGELKFIPIEQKREEIEISAAWRKNNIGRGLEWFVNEICKMHFHADLGLIS